MNLQNPRRNELAPVAYLNNALDWILSRINAVWLVEHDGDGHHTAVTATSVTVTDDVTAEGNMLAEGDVIALQDSGTECGIGTLATVDGTALLPAEVVRQGLLLGGVSVGCFAEWRSAVSPFVSGRELAWWNLGHSTTRPLFRVGVLGGVPTLIDGGSGVSLNLGDVAEPILTLTAATVTATTTATVPHGTFPSHATVIPRFSGDPQSVANAAVISLGTNLVQGRLLVSDITNGNSASFNLRGGVNNAQEVDDATGVFSAASGTAASTNVYWSAGNSRYELENNTGGTVIYRLFLVGI